MEKTKRLVNMSLAAAVLVLFSMALAFAALNDIAHQQEPNLAQEWAMVRLFFFLVLLFLGLAVPTILRLRRALKQTM